jgi:Domain of unknown function (DUF5666)
MALSAKLLALTCAIATCTAGSALAARGCGSEGGMGGTGRPAVSGQDPQNPGPAPTGGMGGTGITASAGVVGVVTGFASICVNGAEVFYRGDTPVEINGRAAAARDLERGQVVRVDAQQVSRSEYRASRIAVLEALIGPVTQVDNKRRMFWVMGQPVRLTPEAVVALSGNGLPAVKSSVRVSGLMNARGEVLASRIEGVSPKAPAYLMANITQLDRRVVQLGWVRVELPAGAENDGLQLGQEVAVRGRWDGEGIVADAYWIDPRLKFANKPKRLSLEGYVLECDAPGRYALNGVELKPSPGVNEPAPYLGRRVIVQGELSGRSLKLDELRPVSLEQPENESGKAAKANPREPGAPGAPEEPVHIRMRCGG